MKTISLSSKRFGRFPFLSFFLSFFLLGFLLSGAKTPEATPLKENHAVCSNRSSCGCYVRYRIDPFYPGRIWIMVYNAQSYCYPLRGTISTSFSSSYVEINGTGDVFEFSGNPETITISMTCSRGNTSGSSTDTPRCGRPFCYIDKSGSISSGDCLLYKFLGTGDEIVPTDYVLLRDGVEVERGDLPTGTISVGPHPNQELRMYDPNCGCYNAAQTHYTTF